MTQTGEDYRVIVELPGVTSSQKASSMIGKVAQLDFREYKEEKITIGTQSATIPQFTKTKLTGTLLSSASVDFNNPKGEPQVLLVFNKQGKELFAQITKKNLKKPLAIFLDDSLLTAPVVQSEIRDGRAVISGSFSTQDAQQLASTLSAGALPVRTTLLETSTIEPTIGAQNIQRSILAGIVGIACVLVFMLVLYRLNGVFAVVSLVAFGLITLLVYEFSGIVITLSGIAGLFLSVGMAVDANILIYERIKEEELNHPRSGAVRLGFQKALRAIREANINTLLIALVLFNPLNLSFLPLSGSVRGFAATLAIGVIVGYITGVVITKNLLWYFYKVDTHD